MEDHEIIALFWQRREEAITAVTTKYGAYCRSIISRILTSTEDREECLSDTWMRVWQTIPPQRPQYLPAFLGRIARNAALDRHAYHSAQKRSGFDLALDELSECVGSGSAEEALDHQLLGERISAFLAQCKPVQRQVFLRRYWYCESISEIAHAFHFSQAKVKSMLHRTRAALRSYLIEEGYSL